MFFRATVFAVTLFVLAPSAFAEHPPTAGWAQKQSTADHSKFEELKKQFTSGNEVTRACLSCHNQADAQLRATNHWMWHVAGEEKFGKGGLAVNNFCIASKKLGDKSCLDCHIGWDAQKGEVNCLVCHSQSEMNWKEAFEDIRSFTEEGDQESLDMVAEIRAELEKSVSHIGRPGSKHCGSCHFYSGGDDGVKRGDMSSGLANPPRDIDVHLSKEGAGLACVDCHNTRNHQVPGRQYFISAQEGRKKLGEPEFRSFLRCDACHTAAPHKEAKLNDHTSTLSCQTCHIPLLARGDATKVWWDWSKAGQLKDGKPFKTHDELGKKNYMSIKGEFKWEKNVKPSYAWFDGSMHNLTLADTVSPDAMVNIQTPNGTPRAPGNKIHPFKVHYAKQPWDPKLKKLLAPMLSGPQGYWETMNWPISLKAGMEAMGLPFSGEYDFIKTSFMYPVSHTIAPKEKALGCDDCHHRAGDGAGSRMAGVPGVYVPGRGDFIDLTQWAWRLLGVVVLLSIFHAIFRIAITIRRMKRSKRKEENSDG